MKRTIFSLFLAVLFVATIGSAKADTPTPGKTQPTATPRVPMQPAKIGLTKFAPLNFRAAAEAEAHRPPDDDEEFEEIDAPQPKPDFHFGVPIPPGMVSRITTNATPPSATGSSPGPVKSFKAEFLSATSIPPDTMGAVGTTHIVSVTNDRLRIQTRDGIELARMTLTSFWAGVTIKGAAIAAFDPKVMFDRFNNRFILISSGNGQSVNSGAMFAVSQTSDPTGLWNRWSVAADPASTAAGGHWIDYPTMGHNKNWIIVNENLFNFGTAGSGFWGTQIYVLDKQAAYNNTLGTISLFEADFNATCTGGADLGCGFTMAPTIVEDNTTDTAYFVEDWDNLAGQLRLSKLTGTASTPVLTVGTQFPQSTHGWVFNAQRITTAGTQSGGYMPQRQQSANLVSGTRIMANDSRVQNAVLRNGTLWCAHTVMLAPTPTPVPSTFGTTNPDTHSGIQWWAIDPTIEGGAAQAPLQRARIEDPSADNCHNGAANTNTVGPRCTSIATQSGEFFAFPNISVNQNNDVLIGFSRFSPLTYPNSGYVIRRSTDPINTTRDPVIFRPGQANYNIGAGSGTTRQNRWGDYSASQTDPLNDTDFWSVQEYAGTQRNDFLAPSYAGPWETWWALIRPTAAAPSTSGSLIISEFRLRGPQGVRDEFVEFYNPGATPVIVNTADNSEGWALVYSVDGTAITSVVAVIPNGTVIPARGHFLIANNPDNTAGGTSALTYSLNTYPSITARTADSDTGWAFDLADNGGLALFKTNVAANFNAGNRLDSVGFSGIAAGLFKEGAGIPAVTAATPAGQMTFYRDSASGNPADTGANENDFIFVDPVIESLGATPHLGGAGPENLGSPIHDTGGAAVVASLLDSGAGSNSPANLFRDPTVVPNGAFGTITFRRTFTNNTGNALPRLRFRIVNITTTPVVGAAADLRALSSSTGSVTLSGGGSVTVNGTTLETPPAQAVGGAFNSSYSANGVALATPVAAGGSINLGFTLGVQGTGTYNFCLVAEGDPVAASAVICFAGTTENTAPSITPGAPVSRTAGNPGSTATIATVSDAQDAAATLTVTATSLPTGITVTGIAVDVAGVVTATVTAGSSAIGGPNNVTLQVADSEGATATATFVVNVTPATPTITPGGPTTFCAGGSVTLTSSSATGNQWYLDGNPIGGATNQTYVATASGAYTVIVTQNAVSSAPSAPVNVTVNPAPPTPTATPGGPTTFCAGGSVTLTSSSATGNQWYLDGNPIGGATNQTYVATASGAYTVVVTASGCTSAPSTAVNVTVNPIPSTPTITPGGPTTFCAGGSVTLTSSSASGNQWNLNGNPIGGATNQTYVATVAGDYTVTVTTSGCSSAPSAVTTVTINPNPDATITAPGSVAADSTGNAASVTNAGGGATYTWGITGGTITAGAGTANITFTAGGAGTLTLNVTVTVGGCSDTKSANVTVTAAPASVTVTSVAPNSGSTLGGTSVTISGSGFNSGASVTFGGSAATNVVVVNAGTITAKTPAHAAGAVNVTVTNTDTTTGTLNNGYTYNQQNFDANGDSMIDPSDIFYLIAYLFTGGPAPAGVSGPVASGDANGDGVVDPADIFYVVNYLFGGGPAPFSRTPGSPVTTAVASRMSGSLTLGQAMQRDGRWFVPVILTMDADSSTPQAISLRVQTGNATDAAMHRGAGLQPIFEVSRQTEGAISYLVAFNERAPLALGVSRSTVIAEIEVNAGDRTRLELDPALTMLVDGSGTNKATVANHGLRVSGTAVGSNDRAPRTQQHQ